MLMSKLGKSCTLNVCSVLYVNHMSIKLSKKSSPQRLRICHPEDNQKKIILLMRFVTNSLKGVLKILSNGSTGVIRDGSQLDRHIAITTGCIVSTDM